MIHCSDQKLTGCHCSVLLKATASPDMRVDGHGSPAQLLSGCSPSSAPISIAAAEQCRPRSRRRRRGRWLPRPVRARAKFRSRRGDAGDRRVELWTRRSPRPRMLRFRLTIRPGFFSDAVRASARRQVAGRSALKSEIRSDRPRARRIVLRLQSGYGDYASIPRLPRPEDPLRRPADLHDPSGFKHSSRSTALPLGSRQRSTTIRPRTSARIATAGLASLTEGDTEGAENVAKASREISVPQAFRQLLDRFGRYAGGRRTVYRRLDPAPA